MISLRAKLGASYKLAHISCGDIWNAEEISFILLIKRIEKG